MPWDIEDRPAQGEKLERPAQHDAYVEDRERRHAAREFYRAAPPYCVQFAADGTVQLCVKDYEYWPGQEPEDATIWRPISRHANLEEAERRLKVIIGGPVFYDAEGRAVNRPKRRKPLWSMPPSDDE